MYNAETVALSRANLVFAGFSRGMLLRIPNKNGAVSVLLTLRVRECPADLPHAEREEYVLLGILNEVSRRSGETFGDGF
jgi:hypothetical protein